MVLKFSLTIIYILSLILFYLEPSVRSFSLLSASYVLVLIYRNAFKTKILISFVFIIFILKGLFIFEPAYLTGDLPRYLWEGKLVRNFINPYLYPPIDPSLEKFKDDNWNKVEYKNLSAIYPPFLQALFAVFAWDEVSWKFFCLFLEVLSVFLIYKILALKKIPLNNLLIFSLSPLVLIEVNWSAHSEIVLISLSLFLYYSLLKKYYFLGSSIIAMGILSKYSFIVVSIVFWLSILKEEGYKSFFKNIFFSLFLVLLLVSPFLDSKMRIFSSLGSYLRYWQYNDSLFFLIGEVFSVDWQDVNSFMFIKLFLFFCWGFLSIIILSKKFSFSKKIIYTYFSYLLFSPVVHPWYLLWFFPFLCFELIYSAYIFSLLVPISYLTMFFQIDFRIYQYLPVYIMFFYEICKMREIKLHET